ncbi:MAG: LptF/LptG family permease [Parachlamydiaceae bacterium]
MTKIWERYFLKKLWGSLLLFLCVFYGLYVLIDYSSHLSGANYTHSKLKPLELLLHYIAEFSIKADLLIPFGLLIGTIHTLTQLNIHSELVALLASGLSIHRLMRPFLISALACVALLYANNQWAIPVLAKESHRLDQKYKVRKAKESGLVIAHSLLLEDKSHLLYKEFDPSVKTFSDVYWVKGIDEVYKIQELDPFKDDTVGYFVDHFLRNNSGILQWVSSSEELILKELSFEPELLKSFLLESKDMPISQLLVNAPTEEKAMENEKAARALTALYRKLLLPWLALIAFIAPAPFCLVHSRALPQFLIYACGIFGLTALYLFFDASTILGERQVITPFQAIFLPMASFISLFLYRFIRMGSNG